MTWTAGNERRALYASIQKQVDHAVTNYGSISVSLRVPGVLLEMLRKDLITRREAVSVMAGYNCPVQNVTLKPSDYDLWAFGFGMRLWFRYHGEDRFQPTRGAAS